MASDSGSHVVQLSLGEEQPAQLPPSLAPSEEVLALHEQHRGYDSFEAFLPDAPALFAQGALLNDCQTLNRVLGLLEPLTGEHIQPEALLIQGPNWRESLVGNGLLSRNRAVLWLLQHLYGSLEVLRQQDIYLVEALTGFAMWLRRQLAGERLVCSEYLTESEMRQYDIPHQDLCALTFTSGSFDLVLCNELFEHVQYLDQAFGEIARVLRPDGRLLATCPLAFGQQDSVVKAVADPATGEPQLLGDAEWHGDPVRPEQGSLVYRIPAWEVLEQLRASGFAQARIHHIASWKHGILGSDLPGVLVIEAQR
jgi:SAM-dependent methyltransferase